MAALDPSFWTCRGGNRKRCWGEYESGISDHHNNKKSEHLKTPCPTAERTASCGAKVLGIPRDLSSGEYTILRGVMRAWVAFDEPGTAWTRFADLSEILTRLRLPVFGEYIMRFERPCAYICNELLICSYVDQRGRVPLGEF